MSDPLVSTMRALDADAAALDADVALIRAHVAAAAPPVMKPPAGQLGHPYLVPGGFYSQLWDHDAVFMGVGLLRAHALGPAHLAGSVANFFDRVTADGEVPGCLLPNGASTTLFHAKPVLIWGAYLAARATGDFGAFKPHARAMRALLAYWRRAPRFDAATGLHVWYDMMESGADDLVYADVPSAHTPRWSAAEHGFRLATPDVQVFMHRELRAFAGFLRRWAADAGEAPPAGELAELAAAAAALRAAVQTRLWVSTDASSGAGYFGGYDVRAGAPLPARTYQMAWPLWEGMATPAQAAAAVAAVSAPDMWTRFGVRTTSADDPRYSNVNIIVPYSNWRGPVWPVQSGVIIAYALVRAGRRDLALQLAGAIVRLLADDLRRSGHWHENYDSDSGLGLASPGFMSWTVCAADVLDNVRRGVDPFDLDDE